MTCNKYLGDGGTVLTVPQKNIYGQRVEKELQITGQEFTGIECNICAKKNYKI